MQALTAEGARNTEALAAATAKLRVRVEAIQRMHVALLRPLLFYKPINMKCLPSHARVHPGSRTAFHAFVHYLVRANVGVLRQVPPAGISNNSTLCNLFFVVLWLLGPSMNSSRLLSLPSSPLSHTTSAASAESSPHAKSLQPPNMLTPPVLDTPDESTPQFNPNRHSTSVDSSHRGSVADSPTPSSPLGPATSDAAPTDPSHTPPLPPIYDSAHNYAMNLTAVSTRRSSRRTGGPSSRNKRRASANTRRDDFTFWRFPTAKLFVPDKLPMDTNREAYLGLNRVGGILSEASRNKPQQGEPRYTDMWDVSEALQEAGALLTRSSTHFQRDSSIRTTFSNAHLDYSSIPVPNCVHSWKYAMI